MPAQYKISDKYFSWIILKNSRAEIGRNSTVFVQKFNGFYENFPLFSVKVKRWFLNLKLFKKKIVIHFLKKLHKRN